MKKYILLVIIISISCSENEINILPTISKSINDLHAPTTSEPGTTATGTYIGFNLMDQAQVNDNTWDIAFRGTTILVNGGNKGDDDEPERTGNGGGYIHIGAFQDIKSAVVEEIKQDSFDSKAIPTGSGNGWYNYDFQSHTISAIPGRTIIIRTHDGKYAKLEILCYYKGCPETPTMESEAQYYTFNYIIQPNEGITTFD
tara:strand:- start:1731 stop:2330 length:600 start_codon:yes stop_codon:yes gene_type:complete